MKLYRIKRNHLHEYKAPTNDPYELFIYKPNNNIFEGLLNKFSSVDATNYDHLECIDIEEAFSRRAQVDSYPSIFTKVKLTVENAKRNNIIIDHDLFGVIEAMNTQQIETIFTVIFRENNNVVFKLLLKAEDIVLV